MNPLKWLTERNSARGTAMSLYKRGLSRVEKHDSQGAMEAYNAAIDVPDVPEDVKAMALYNRALLFTALGETAKAVADLNAVMTMSAELRTIKSTAKRRLDRMQRQQDAGSPAHSHSPDTD